MQARCPHCSTVFNTERAGIQFCPNCGQQINVPDPAGMPPPPPPGAPATPGGPPTPGSVGPGAGGRGPVPWEERSQRGFLAAFFANCKMVCMEPEQFWSRMRPDGALGDGLFFGWLAFAIYGVIAIPFQVVGNGAARRAMEWLLEANKDFPADFRRTLEQSLQAQSVGAAIGAMIAYIVAYPVLLIVGSAITHLFAMMFGAAKNGFNATVRVMGYATAPMVLAWVPCCGGLVATIYSVVLAIWGLGRAQESTMGRAAFAVLVFPLLLCCCGVAVVALGAMAGASAANAH